MRLVDNQKARLLDLIDRFCGKKIAVWGDFILDEYVYGNTRRISREAPVLIISYQKNEFLLGGAGNSLLNLKSLAADPIPIGVIGRDEAGEKILEILREKDIPTKHLIRREKIKTPVKTRILAGEENTRKQQILRIDKEYTVPDEVPLKQLVFRHLAAAKEGCDALLISDYNYLTVKEDVFRQAVPAFHKAGLTVTLDSRFRLLRFRDVTIATPNEPEVAEALKIELGDNPGVLAEAGKTILKRLGSPALLITRGSKGMALFEKGKPPVFLPVQGTTDIVDITGAGDTVISVLTLALACGAAFQEAARLANYAGGLVVMKKGTAAVTPEELRKVIVS